MNCKELRRLLSAGERQATREAVEAHASECVECARVLEEEHLVDGLLAGLRGASLELDASPAIERQLLAEFRDRNRLRNSGSPFVTWPWIAAAAAVLAAAGLVVWSARRPAADGPAVIASVPESDASRQTPTTAEPQTAPGMAAEPAPSGRVLAPPPAAPIREAMSAGQSGADAPRRNQWRAAEGTEFIPTMRFMADEPGTELQLVRVRVSKRTLEGFGLSLDPRYSERPVKADLIIGPDGLTRAVRFISEREP